jgi:enoyl-CoA hydratase/carnithine racemase
VIESITKGGVAVLAMRHGRANALDTELCQALCDALDDAAAAVVLTGVGRAGSSWSPPRTGRSWPRARAGPA